MKRNRAQGRGNGTPATDAVTLVNLPMERGRRDWLLGGQSSFWSCEPESPQSEAAAVATPGAEAVERSRLQVAQADSPQATSEAATEATPVVEVVTNELPVPEERGVDDGEQASQ